MDSSNVTHDDKLALFKEITSFEDEDHDKVLRLLESTQWNLEIAIPRFFDGNFPSEDEEILPSNNNVTLSSGVDPFEDMALGNLHSRRPPMTIPQTQRLTSPLIDYQDVTPRFPKAVMIPETWKFKLGLPSRIQDQQNQAGVTPILFLLLLVPRTLLLILTGISRCIDFLFPGFHKIMGFVKDLESFPSENTFNEVQPDFQEYFDQVTDYNKEKTDDESISRRVIFHSGEYNQAYNFAKTNLKWLIILLVNDKTSDGLKSLVPNDSFKKFIDKNDIILWGGNVDYLEPWEVGKSYRVRKLPQLLLVANVSKAGEFPLMSVVNKVSPPVQFSADTLKLILHKFQKSINMYEPQLVSQRYDKKEQDLARQLRREQDDAYNRSLIADKEKMEAKLLEKRKEEELLIKEEEKLRKIKLRESYLISKSIDLLEEPKNVFEKGNHTTIQFRLNTGERIVQKFLATKTLYDIFLFIDCKLFLKTFSEIKDEKELVEILRLEKMEEGVDLSSYEHDFKFDLIQPIPRFVLEPNIEVKVGDVKEIWPNGNLLVEFDTEEDEEEDEEEEE